MKKHIVMVLAIGMLAFACKKEEKAQLQLQFKHQVDGAALVADTIIYQNAAGNDYSVITLKYFVSRIQLETSGGSIVRFEGPFYVDAFDASTLEFDLPGEYESQSIQSVSFVFGLNETDNVDGAFPNAPESNMEWPAPMGGENNAGYHYMKLEGKYIDSNQMVMNYNTHTGASMGNPYHFTVNLPESDFELGGEDLTLELMMNINHWYEGPNVYDFNAVGMMIMGNQQAQATIQANGADVFSLQVK